MTVFLESATAVDCQGTMMAGIFHNTGDVAKIGIVLLVGGPQYRVGSHRMFVDIARKLSLQGFPTLRFDFRGMGDSEGDFQGFDDVGDDIAASVSHLLQIRTDLKSVVLIGLCDGATAAALYSPTDSRVSGQVLLNPWVHSEVGGARAYVWYYYPKRLLQIDFWRSFLTGKVEVMNSLKDFSAKLVRAFSRSDQKESNGQTYIDRMRRSLGVFDGHTLCVTSENDLTAVEFNDLLASDADWRAATKDVTRTELMGADHTLSSKRDLVLFVDSIVDWLRTVELEK